MFIILGKFFLKFDQPGMSLHVSIVQLGLVHKYWVFFSDRFQKLMRLELNGLGADFNQIRLLRFSPSVLHHLLLYLDRLDLNHRGRSPLFLQLPWLPQYILKENWRPNITGSILLLDLALSNLVHKDSSLPNQFLLRQSVVILSYFDFVPPECTELDVLVQQCA